MPLRRKRRVIKSSDQLPDRCWALPKEILNLFNNQEHKNKEEAKPNLVSEEFALKAMALVKANTQSIKVPDILK